MCLFWVAMALLCLLGGALGAVHGLRARPLMMSADVSRLSAVAPIFDWVASHGGDVSRVRVSETSAMGLGLEAAKPTRRGDVLLSVPESLAITAESALRSEILGPYLAEFEPELADYSFIAVALLNEERLGDQSPLSLWLSSASRSITDDLPLLWDKDAQAELEQSTAAPFAERRASAQTDFAWLQENVFDQAPMVFPSSVFSESQFLRALSEAISRSVYVQPDSSDEPARLALMPLLELTNHAAEPSATVSFCSASPGFLGRGESPATVQLLAVGDVAEGQPVYTKYADATQGELLVDYGFISEPIPAETSLTFELISDDLNLYEKEAILEGAGLAASQSFILTESQPLPDELMAYLRLIHLGPPTTPSDAFLLEALFADSLWREHLPLPISRQNEAAALTVGFEAATEALLRLRGSVQEDLATLAEAPRESRAYRLAAVRYAERRALEAATSAFRVQMGSLDSLEYYQERRLRMLNLTPIETEEELEALKAAGRAMTSDGYDW